MDPNIGNFPKITNTLFIRPKDINQTSSILFPVRCYNCGHVLGGFEEDVSNMLEEGYDYEEIFEELEIGQNRGCCRSSIFNPQQIVKGKFHGVQFPESFKEPFSFIPSDDRAKHSTTMVRLRSKRRKGRRNFLNLDLGPTKKITTKAGISLSDDISNIIPSISKQLEANSKPTEKKTDTKVFPGVTLEKNLY